MELTESLKEQLQGALNGANNAVEITLYKGDENNAEAKEIADLLHGVASVLTQVSIKETLTGDGLERYPALKIAAPGLDSSYVYYGLPGGYEFSSLVEAIRTVASGSVELDAALIEKIKSINQPVSLEIFVTPTCSYCPAMVIAGYRISSVNPLIKTEVVDASSFRPYARSKGVMGVPKTIINQSSEAIEGSIAIDEFINKIISSL